MNPIATFVFMEKTYHRNRVPTREKRGVKPTAGSGLLGATSRSVTERLRGTLLGNILARARKQEGSEFDAP
jgi:hypothetical protein